MSNGDSRLPRGVFGPVRRPGPLGLDTATPPSIEGSPQSSGVATSVRRAAEQPDRLGGHFTIERRIVGLTLSELEDALGYKKGLLAAGARIYVFEENPQVGEFVFAGSTITPAAKDLASLEERMKRASNVIPGAWNNERLIKVVPIQKPSDDEDNYPRAKSPLEQWVALAKMPVKFVRELHGNERYYPR